MDNLKNIMPVGVHLASGGDARVRVGGDVLSLEDVSQGSFTIEHGTGYRLFYFNRSGNIGLLALGYESPLDASNASLLAGETQIISDDVAQGTTVYFALLDTDGLDLVQGGENDTLHVSFYG